MLKALGRICLSAIFILGGLDAFKTPGPRTGKVEGAGIPEPETAVKINGATMVIGGILLALGIMPKVAAGALIGTLIPTTLVGHPFWQEEDPKAVAMQRTHFLKNLGLLGGLLWIIAEVSEERQAKNHVEIESLPM